MIGGVFMVAIGLLYLAFEDVVLSGPSTRKLNKAGEAGKSCLGRIVTGVQVR